MSYDLSDSQLKALGRQGRTPVTFKRNKPLPVFRAHPYPGIDRLAGVGLGWSWIHLYPFRTEYASGDFIYH